MMWSSKSLTALLLTIPVADAGCPYVGGGQRRGYVNPHTEEGRRILAERSQRQLAFTPRSGDHGIPEGGFAAVRESIKDMLVTSQDFFPADFEAPVGPNYGGLMIRLAWHCSGSYRASDGRGGCDGGRIRFDPELNWDDNANLNNALKLLEPIKELYGEKLSWGDLIILAGTTAIESMGGPILGFCGGRVDDADGSNSLLLGPSPEQEELAPCLTIDQQGACQSPLGPTTVGLIYVNPEGPVNATGDPVASGLDIRNAFARMGFDDYETVSLIGGGHAFGKTHGACSDPPCGEEPLVGLGPNTFTSGFEGAWTTTPTTWSNQFFTNLLDLEWEIGEGPGGNLQWAPTSGLPVIMLTTDIAMSSDPDYLPISQEYAANITSLEDDFAHAWYRLTSGDMGPRERCINEDPENIPPAEPWQYPLPMADEAIVNDYIPVRSMIQELVDTEPSNVEAFSNLAYRCASTYRDTDYRGGCNGAKIRFAPESEWPENEGTAEALVTLEAVKEAHPTVSYADLIVLAGQAALEAAGSKPMAFCGGRVDAMDANGSDSLAPRHYTPEVVSIRDDMQVKGLTPEGGVALFARPQQGVPLNQFFIDLVSANQVDLSGSESALLEEEFLPIVQKYADDEEALKEEHAKAWIHMMTADRHDGPTGNVCATRNDATLENLPRDYGIPEGGFAAVREDIKEMLVTSQDFFPADFEAPHGPHYGGLMIRLAWHCSGSYRDSDGRGGCDGGRIRFDPELNWEDNGNLNNALKLLEPIKEKYGSALSWGDLIILSGTTAIEAMGGPVLGFCGGRVDDNDGSDSLILGPSPEQEELTPCQSIGMQGQCKSPLGPTTVGLIYVNPEGPVTAHGDPVASGLDIREAFSRMGFNDTESVALIGGGHAFGKTHGACLTPPCGEEPLVGIGPNTYTAGFEGAWTTTPTTWSNQFFSNLLNLEWEEITGPGGKLQWAPLNSDLPVIMLTSDIALAADPDYLAISQEFANDIDSLNDAFSQAWYRLMTGDMGPSTRCINEDPNNIPPPQWWQYPIPASSEPEVAVDYVGARTQIQAMIDENSDYIAAFSNLAFRCASTFRSTDHRGGCNGARIRFAPESEWPENEGTADALTALESIKEGSAAFISYADLIVLAGQTALETAGDIKLSFCGGRQDATDAAGSDSLAPRYYTPAVVSVRDDMEVKGLAPYEGVALYAIPSTAVDDMSTSVTVAKSNPNTLSNQYFIDLLAGEGEFNEYEMALLEPEFKSIVEEYAADESFFLEMFSAAWTKMMNADRFAGPVDNICDTRVDVTLASDPPRLGETEDLESDGPEEESADELESKAGGDSGKTGADSDKAAESAGVASIPGMTVGLLFAAVTALVF